MIQIVTQTGLLAEAGTTRALAGEFGTPLYIIDVSQIVRAMDGLRDGLMTHYANCEVTYSVKTNYLAAIQRRVLQVGYRLEVVSRREIRQAQSVGAEPSQLLFNGPVKSVADLEFCHQHSMEVNVDSVDELEAAAALGSPERPFRLGIRVAAALNNGSVSRFGVDFDDADSVAAVGRLISEGSIHVAGLHLHHSSRRDAASYCERIDRLQTVARRLGITPEYLDIGGGIGSVPPPSIAARLPYAVDSHEQWAAVVGRHARAVFGEGGPKLIVEPGIGVLAGAMNYVTSIVAVKARAGGATIAVCDGSMFDVNPLRSAIPPPCVLLPSGDSGPVATEPIRLYGGTCMEIDQLGVLDGELAPRKGDLVVVTNVGAYSVCLAPDFIVPRAPIYSLDDGALIRHPEPNDGFRGAGQ
ncbi:MAG: alanine racemase [Acidobacteria bacterium]|nr:alanine racemase [Acidobacteriota bacterium]